MTGTLKMAKLDYYTMKPQFGAYWSLAVILIMFGSMNSSILLLGFNGAWFMALMSSNVFSEQEKNKLDRLYGSVSIKWAEVVTGRYVYLFLSFSASYILAVFVYIGFALSLGKQLSLPDILQGFGLSLLAFSVIISIQIPMFFRMGYTKARAWVLLPYLLVIGVVAAPYYVGFMFGVQNFPSLASLLSDISWLISFNKVFVTVGSILLSCFMLFLSCRTSIFVYRRRC